MNPARTPPALALAALSVLSAGCSPVYAWKAAAGHMGLLAKRRPVERVLADPAVPDATKEKLRLVQEARLFAFETMGVPRTRSYAHFVALGRPWVTKVVTAAPKTRLEPHEWWFPFVGKVPYKGYFKEDDARREAAALEKQGLDTFVFGAGGYSLLGWLPDPLLSTMLERPAGRTVEIVLHELAHRAVYKRGQGDFNESAATFIGEEGAGQFLARRFGVDSPELKAYEASRRDEEAFDRRMETVYAELKALYDSPAPEDEKLRRREEVFERARGELGLTSMNNATVLAQRRYRRDLSGFRRAWDLCGRDWPRTLKTLRSLDRKRPWDALAALSACGVGNGVGR